MDRSERKHQLRAMLDALQMPAAADDTGYQSLLAQMDVRTNSDRDILRSALLDAVYECRRRHADESGVLGFLTWLGGYLPE